MAITQIKGSNIEDGTVVAADIKDDSITNAKIKSDAAIATTKISGLAASATTDTTDASNISAGTLPTARLASALDLSGKTVTLPAAAVTAHAVTPTLDSPVITGTLSVLDGATVTHTIANWSDEITYTITPTNCTVGAINASGVFVITHTSGSPSYTIKATTAVFGLDDSSLVTKNIVMQLSAPTLSSPADVAENVDVVYTITSTTAFDDKIILDIGSSNFTYQSVSHGSGSKVGNTVEVTGFTTNNPAVTIQFTAEATYSVTATSVKIDGSYGTSANSAADSILCQNFVGMVATGGTQLADDGDYRIRKFVESDTADFEVTTVGSLAEVEILVIAGGGGGASGYYAGGGGGGGFMTDTITGITATTYSVSVGAGGGTNADHQNASPGNDSYFGDGGARVTATGGGFGNGYSGGSTGGDGGSGGGAAGSSARPGGSGNTPTKTPSQGNDGGSVGGYGDGAGGGGAGQVGQDSTYPATASTNGGDGGDGRTSDITGSTLYYAGGGAGGSGYTNTQVVGGEGGLGGGGNGSGRTGAGGAWVNPTAGTDELGGGGGGETGPGYNSGAGGVGGDGVVIVRYKFQ